MNKDDSEGTRRSSSVRRRRSPGSEPGGRQGGSLFTELDWLGLARALNLTKRQVEIAKLLCQGCTYEGMAVQMSISVNTVRMHMCALFSKLGVRDRVGVVLHLALAQRGLPGH